MVGDAAHQFPPTGGLGVNTGMQGMHNAMWKLAYCVKGDAGWRLMESYNTERRPVAARITAQSLQNSINVGRIQAARQVGGESGLAPEEIVAESRRYGNHLGVEFGAAYASSAVIADGSTPPTVADSYSDYVQSATPGCRAPHLWIGSEDAPFSTLALWGSDFTVLAGPSGQAWCDQAIDAAAALGLRIRSFRVGAPGLEDLGDFASAYGVESTGAVLVRPDGHVAWREPGAAQREGEITAALSQILDRPERPAKAKAAPIELALLR
jgi:putative polyketide hydroxylase